MVKDIQIIKDCRRGHHTFSSGTTAYLSDGNTESFPAKTTNVKSPREKNGTFKLIFMVYIQLKILNVSSYN